MTHLISTRLKASPAINSHLIGHPSNRTRLIGNKPIHYVKTKLSKNIAILYKVKYKLSCKVLRSLYCTLILPYLTYCVAIWGYTYKSNLISIDNLQKRAIRIISGVLFLEHTFI